MIRIRKLKKEEIVAACAIVEKNYSKKYAKLVRSELKEMFGSAAIRPTYFAAVENGRLLGFAGCMVSWMDYHITNIFWVNVDPQLQRMGIGKRLVGEIVSRSRKDKKVHLLLLSTSSPSYYQKHFKFRSLCRFGPKKHHVMALSTEA